MKNETGALTQPMNPELDSILKHRLAGHRIRFSTSESSASIECSECKSKIISGIRHEMEVLFECTLQFPEDRKTYGAAFPGQKLGG